MSPREAHLINRDLLYKLLSWPKDHQNWLRLRKL